MNNVNRVLKPGSGARKQFKVESLLPEQENVLKFGGVKGVS